MAFEEHAGTDVHPVDEIPPPGRMLAFGAQHVAAMYAGVVAPPLIVGEALGMPGQQRTLLIGASLLTAGMATLLQSWGIWRIGARLPFVNGVTFGAFRRRIKVWDVFFRGGNAYVQAAGGATLLIGCHDVACSLEVIRRETIIVGRQADQGGALRTD